MEVAVLFVVAVASAVVAACVKHARATRRERRRDAELVDSMLAKSSLWHPYRLPYESDGDALDRIIWGAEQWAETSGVRCLFDWDDKTPTWPEIKAG